MTALFLDALILGALNLTEKSYHETMREKWVLQLGKSKKTKDGKKNTIKLKS